jgi:hypothetical protein
LDRSTQPTGLPALKENGDRWLLSHDDETGSYLVRHEPNLSSGGQAKEMPVPTFLAGSGTSPQTEALRTLLHKGGVVSASRR